MEHKRQQVAEILVSSGFGYFHQDKYIALLYKALLPDDLMPELVERIGLFTWAVLNLEAYSGYSIDFLPEDFTKIINGDYSSKAYKELWKDIENRYRCKDWYLGMIAQVEAEEALKGRSEI